jgi:hypothetical protein
VADLLSRKAQDLITQKALNDWSRNQVLLPPERFYGGAPEADLLAILPDTPDEAKELPAQDPQRFLLIDAILAANRESTLLSDQQKLAKAGLQGYSLQDGLLL